VNCWADGRCSLAARHSTSLKGFATSQADLPTKTSKPFNPNSLAPSSNTLNTQPPQGQTVSHLPHTRLLTSHIYFNRVLREMYPKAPADALDLMEKMLYFNPEKRITASVSLSLPLFLMCSEDYLYTSLQQCRKHSHIPTWPSSTTPRMKPRPPSPFSFPLMTMSSCLWPNIEPCCTVR